MYTEPGCILVEASLYGRILGIGLNETNTRRTPQEKWKGLNLLGQI